MGIHLETTSGRTLTIKGQKQVMRQIQRQAPTTHSYTVHINLRADGNLANRLPVVLYEPKGAPKKFNDEVAEFENLFVYHSKSGLMDGSIAEQWMQDAFIPQIDKDNLLIIGIYYLLLAIY